MTNANNFLYFIIFVLAPESPLALIVRGFREFFANVSL